MAEMSAADARLLSTVNGWAEARANRLAEKHAMESFRCELAERGDYETGDQGVPPCYCTHTLTNEWCKQCQSRDPHFTRMVQLKSLERRYLRGLCSLLARREKAKAAPRRTRKAGRA